ncbi:hypothetical protein [Paracoccus luteus]|uniref:hypothetical protein n=1 Tax=Paracoccus luteus TaxID=2508543 RepID=UPI00107026AC|nr:hypothetical protein [Paracoccus luteus]
MSVKARIARLEAAAPSAVETAVEVVFLTPPDGSPETALFVGGGGISREEGEDNAAFMARAEAAITFRRPAPPVGKAQAAKIG